VHELEAVPAVRVRRRVVAVADLPAHAHLAGERDGHAARQQARSPLGLRGHVRLPEVVVDVLGERRLLELLHPLLQLGVAAREILVRGLLAGHNDSTQHGPQQYGSDHGNLRSD
jgi:hypothetical protein